MIHSYRCNFLNKIIWQPDCVSFCNKCQSFTCLSFPRRTDISLRSVPESFVGIASECDANKWVRSCAAYFAQKIGENSESSPACTISHMASESFSLALQQRAAREVVSEEMPRRALATRLLLFCEITSALLIVELGLFAHILAMAVALIIVPMLLAVRMGLYVVGMGFYAYAALCLGVVGVACSLERRMF